MESVPTDAASRRVAVVLEHMRLENEHDFSGCIAEFGRPRYEIVATGERHDGAAEVERFLRENQRAFPDFRFDPRETRDAGDAVLVEGVFSGTHEGTWRGLPATGRNVRFPMAVVFTFEGDALVGERIYFDLGTPLRQLGVARDPTTPSGRVLVVVNHPITIAGAVLRSLRKGRNSMPQRS